MKYTVAVKEIRTRVGNFVRQNTMLYFRIVLLVYEISYWRQRGLVLKNFKEELTLENVKESQRK